MKQLKGKDKKEFNKIIDDYIKEIGGKELTGYEIIRSLYQLHQRLLTIFPIKEFPILEIYKYINSKPKKDK